MLELVTDLRMTSDEAPLPALLALGLSGSLIQRRRGGGMKYAPLALPRRRLLLPALALGFLLLLAGCASVRAKKHYERGSRLLDQSFDQSNKRLAEEAEMEFREAIRLNPNDTMALDQLGFALVYQGKYDQAEKVHREAIKINPYFGAAHNHLVMDCSFQGKDAEAEAANREWIRLMPENADAHISLGNIRKDQGRIDEAIVEFRTGVRLDPYQYFAVEDLAKMLDGAGRRKEARIYWEQLLLYEKKPFVNHPTKVERIKKRLAEPD